MILIPFIRRIEALEARVAELESQLEAVKQDGIEQIIEEKEFTLWTPKNISKYAGYSYRYVITNLIHRPGFPASVGNDKKHARRRYIATEVKAYFKNRTGKNIKRVYNDADMGEL